MKIVVLNDSFFNQGHKNRLQTLGEFVFYESTTSLEDAIKRSGGGADIVLGDQYLVDFNKDFFDAAKGLKLLALNSTSYALVDLQAASAHAVKVTNTPGFSQRAVAELVIGLTLDAVRRISYGVKKFKENPFELDPATPEAKPYIGYEIEGKTMGIIGLGRIGQQVAKIAQGIGMKVIAWDRSPKQVQGVELVEIQTLAQSSDAVVVTLAYSDETKDTLSADLIKLLKPNAVVVNIGKMDLVNRDALHKALKENKIRGAALDWSQFQKGDPMFDLDNIVLTPHIGSYTEEAFYKNLPDMIVANVEAFVAGKPVNLVT